MRFFEIINGINSMVSLWTSIKEFFRGRWRCSRARNLEEIRIDALYRPNLRVNAYGTTDRGLSISIENHGEDVVIENIESFPAEWLDSISTSRWMPWEMDKNTKMVIPLFGKYEMFKDGSVIITLTDKINRRFQVRLSSVNNMFMVSGIKQI